MQEETYQQIRIANALVNFVNKARPAREGKAVVKRVQFLSIYIRRLEEEWCKDS